MVSSTVDNDRAEMLNLLPNTMSQIPMQLTLCRTGPPNDHPMRWHWSLKLSPLCPTLDSDLNMTHFYYATNAADAEGFVVRHRTSSTGRPPALSQPGYDISAISAEGVSRAQHILNNHPCRNDVTEWNCQNWVTSSLAELRSEGLISQAALMGFEKWTADLAST